MWKVFRRVHLIIIQHSSILGDDTKVNALFYFWKEFHFVAV